MYAITITQPGPDAAVLTEVTVPEPAPGQVRVAVEAASVNPVDLSTRDGVFHQYGVVTAERIGLGWDFAGTVDAVGADVATGLIGRRVAGLLNPLTTPLGAQADFVVLAADAVAQIPSGLDTTAAATVPLNAATAAQGLALFGDETGTLLVTGAAGAVGGFAVALAARAGWTVIGLARAADEEFVSRSGATKFVSRLEDVGAESVDAVFDAAVLGDPALAAVRNGGRYVGVAPAARPTTDRPVTVNAVGVEADGAELAELLALTADGTLEARIAGTLALSAVAEAHRHVAAGGSRGRWVLLP